MVSSKHTTPTLKQPAGLKQRADESARTPKQLFVGAVLSMSWQLAVVVLVPVVGGFKIDQHFQTTPVGTIVGFVLAIAGMAIVVQRAVKEVTPPSGGGKP
jgi:F0F1-type ATP synthase assembly protein I